jgi:signal transduction histidine kinase
MIDRRFKSSALMHARSKIRWIEWGFVIFLALVCATLTALQYRWTGEIALSEMSRLRSSLREQGRNLSRAFDAELAASCSQLLVTRTEILEQGRDAACLQRLRNWLATHHRPIFRRIAIGSFSNGEPQQLFVVDPATQSLKPTEWPAEWAELDEHNRRHCARGRSWPSFFDSNGTLMEFQIPGTSDPGGSPSGDWMIFELDLDYAKNTWLPELVQTHLDPSGDLLKNVEIRTTFGDHTTIFASTNGSEDGDTRPYVTHFNYQGRNVDDTRSRMILGRWALEVRHCPGELESAVAGSRQRNLGVALALNALILAAGIALVRHTRRSRELAEAQMNFVASVSHELRTPLTVIQGAAQNLQRGIVSEPGKIEQYSGLIGQHAGRLGELIEQVLEFASMQKQRISRPLQPVSVADILHEATAAAAPDAQAAGCQVELNAPSSLPLVSGDAPALRRVFQNLIANAAKHGGDGKWIGISAAPTDGGGPPMVEVKVADRGPGIPPSEQPQIFRPFFRGARAHQKQIRGSGLGLSLAREIVEACGGIISVISSEGRGAAFSVKLPVAAPTGAA